MRVLKLIDDHFEEVLLILIFTVMVVAVSLQVFMRYVMESSLSWTEEVSRYCFIWSIYIGISYGVKRQRHIKVDLLLMAFKERGKIILNIISNLIFLAFALFVVIYGYGLAEQIISYGQKSPAVQIPMGLVYLSAPVGMGLASLRIMQQIIKQIQSFIALKSDEDHTRMLEAVEKEQ